MTEQPQVNLGDEITVSNNRAIVCGVYSHTKEIKVVYLQHGTKPIAENASWKDGQWQFSLEGPVGDYADRLPSLQPFVDKLKGYPPHKKPATPKLKLPQGSPRKLVSGSFRLKK